MHLLYLDDSGAVNDPNQEYFVLAGVSVFERETHWIEQQLNAIAQRFEPQNKRCPSVGAAVPCVTGR